MPKDSENAAHLSLILPPVMTLPVPQKRRRWPAVLIVLAVLLALTGWFVVRPILDGAGKVNDLLYEQTKAAYRDITILVSGTATVQPRESVQVAATVQGKILEAPFDEGDTVSAGQLLFRMDAGSVENSIRRAQVSVEQSRLSYQNLLKDKTSAQKKLHLTAPVSGTVTMVYVQEGDELSSGDTVADLTDDAGVIHTVTAGTSGQLSRLYISQGDRVYRDHLLGYQGGSGMEYQMENALLSLRSAELSLQSSLEQLDSYTIASPISGTVVAKALQAGDTPSGVLSTIYDLSGLTLQMQVDELYINRVRVGQQVTVTSDALEGESFRGAVSKIGMVGTTMSGVTTYPVTVDIDEPGELLPGMNVSADILIERASGILTIPAEALLRGNVVQVLPPDAVDTKGGPDYTRLEERPVTLGRNDDDYIEILSGLSDGETVVYQHQESSLLDTLMAMNQLGVSWR